jgi:hypothetical protein
MHNIQAGEVSPDGDMHVRRSWRGAAGCKPVLSGEGVRIPQHALVGREAKGKGGPDRIWLRTGFESPRRSFYSIPCGPVWWGQLPDKEKVDGSNPFTGTLYVADIRVQVGSHPLDFQHSIEVPQTRVGAPREV